MTTTLPSLTGTVVAGWTVLKRVGASKYNCRCPAGHKGNQKGGALRRGEPAPCNKCLWLANPKLKKKRGAPLPPIGTVRGCWTVISHEVFLRSDRLTHGWRLMCRCSCPAQTEAIKSTTEWAKCEGHKCKVCGRFGIKRAYKARAPRAPKPPKPAKPAKLAVAPKPKPVKVAPLVDVPLPTVWNAWTINDLMLRRAARQNQTHTETFAVNRRAL